MERRSWKTASGITTVALALILLMGAGRKFDLKSFSIGFTALLASFTIGRTLSKKNRGLYRQITAEVGVTILSHIWNFTAIVLGLDPVVGFSLIVGTQVLFNVCAGISEAIGVRTQWIFR